MLEDVVKTAYDNSTMLAFKPNLYFSQFAHLKRWRGADRNPMPGDVVTFNVERHPSAPTRQNEERQGHYTGEQHEIRLKEYGETVVLTNKLRLTAFDDIDLAAARTVGLEMANAVERIARVVFDSRSDLEFCTHERLIGVEWIRRMFNKLDSVDVSKTDSGFYVALLHPDIIFDLRNESGSTGTWRTVKEYVEPESMYNGEIGSFEGFRIISTTNAKQEGAIYSSYFLGYGAVGYAEGINPHLKILGPCDNLGRTINVGWYGLFGFGELIPEALHKFFCKSSIGPRE